VAPDQPAAAAPVSQPAVEAAPATGQKLVLPVSVVSKADVGHSLRELEQLDEYLHQAAIKGAQAKDLPKLGHALEEVTAANKLNLLYPEHRATLKSFLTAVKAKAPVVHMSFPSEASNDFTSKLLTWFRTETHPLVLLHIGLQPELAAGCTVRTTNKMYDFSFRKRFEKSKMKLIAALEASAKEATAEINQAVQQAAPQPTEVK
jgi:hypothetical protein